MKVILAIAFTVHSAAAQAADGVPAGKVIKEVKEKIAVAGKGATANPTLTKAKKRPLIPKQYDYTNYKFSSGNLHSAVNKIVCPPVNVKNYIKYTIEDVGKFGKRATVQIKCLAGIDVDPTPKP